MKQGKIAILIPDLRGGGAERVTVNLANELVQRGHSVDVLLVIGRGEFSKDLDPRIKIIDLHCKRLRDVVWPLRRYLLLAKPDGLLACMWPLTVIAVWARALARVSTRVVAAEHITWSRNHVAGPLANRLFVKATMRATFPFAEKIVIVSHQAAADLRSFAQLPEDMVQVVYNPVVGSGARAEPSPVEPAGWCSGSHKRILAVGTLKPQKDFGNLLRAFAEVSSAMDARLLILGEGELRSQLEQEAQDLGVADKVFMPGFVAHPSAYYRHADLFVLSSIYEGLPTVLIEALDAGVRVVSTDCPSGPNEILVDGSIGVLVPPSDSHALAAAMVRSLSADHDPSSYRERAQMFAISAATDEYEKLLLHNARQERVLA